MSTFRVMFKDPDGVYDSLLEQGIIYNDGSAKDEAAYKLVKKYIEFDEYVYLDFDTEAGTVTVVPAD